MLSNGSNGKMICRSRKSAGSQGALAPFGDHLRERRRQHRPRAAHVNSLPPPNGCLQRNLRPRSVARADMLCGARSFRDARLDRTRARIPSRRQVRRGLPLLLARRRNRQQVGGGSRALRPVGKTRIDHALPWQGIDPGFVAEALADAAARYDLRAVAFDRWRIEDLKRELAAIGVEANLVPHGQGFKDMSPALALLSEPSRSGSYVMGEIRC